VTVRFGPGIFTGQLAGGVSATSEDRNILALAGPAESCGFDPVWVSEHYLAAARAAERLASNVTPRLRDAGA